jgi:deoxyribodipyrimidine photo-lyase
VPLVATGSAYLVSPGRVTKTDGARYRVFTPFFRRWQEMRWGASAVTGPDAARWLNPAGLRDAVDIPDPGAALDLDAGEQAALSRWAEFVGAKLDDYAEGRNRPGTDGRRQDRLTRVCQNVGKCPSTEQEHRGQHRG